MKTIGIIGGLAWPSTVVYYEQINRQIGQRLGGQHSAKLVLVQTDLTIVEKWERARDWGSFARCLAGLALNLKAAGAEFFIIACNTAHATLPFIKQQSGGELCLPFIHIVDVCAQRVVAEGYKKVALLGTKYTMNKDAYFVRRMFDEYGLQVCVPTMEQQEMMETLLKAELSRGVFTAESRAKFRDVIQELVISHGAEVLVLGCTEFGRLVQSEDSPVPVIDTLDAHVDAVVDMALADES